MSSSGPDASGPENGTPAGTGAPSALPGGSPPVRSPGSSRPGAPPASAAYADLGPLGAMSRAYLRGSPATSLVVEVDWVPGRKPTADALGHLEGILRRETVKPNGVDVRLGAEIRATDTSWTVEDLLGAERAFRSARSAGTRATMWIAYVGGEFAQSSTALGVSFAASAAAIFRDRIDDATTALILASEIERSVLVHEAGHLLGLVNIGYTSRIDHEDAAHPKHSSNPASVMYWAVEDISVRTLLRGGPPDDFDEADRADLAFLRGT